MDEYRDSNTQLRAEIKSLQAKLNVLSRKATRTIVPSMIKADQLQFGDDDGAVGNGKAALLRGEPVAVKELSLGAAPANHVAARELALAVQLNGHECVVATHGVVVAAERVSVVTERMAVSLEDTLLRGKLTVPQRLTIAHCVADGLRFCHAQGVVHKDLKPAHVLLDDDLQTAKLGDFGTARASGHAALEYVAPEVLTGAEFDAASDVYAFGVLLWAIFSGETPFAGQREWVPKVLAGTRPSPEPATMPHAVAELMKRCWRAQPSERPTMRTAVAPLAQALRDADLVAAQADEDRRECLVCADAARATAFVPCGHLCCCDDCAKDLRDCPLCRTSIESRLKIFYA
jgi:serine/threonine protein kinase